MNGQVAPAEAAGSGPAPAHPSENAVAAPASGQATADDGAAQTAAGGGGGDLAGPLAFLGALRESRPSDLASHVAGLAGAAAPSLEAARSATTLAPRPAPTGLEPGPAVAVPAAPAVAPRAVDAPAAGGGAGGALEPTGATDPALADRWAAAGSSALEQTAGASVAPAPSVGPELRPVVAGAELAPHELQPAAPIPSAVPSVSVAGEEGPALDRAMGSQLREQVGELLAPAGAASAQHAVVSSRVRAEVDSQVSSLRADTAVQQRAAGERGDSEVAQLHSGWATERAGIVSEHHAAISAESARARSEATRTIEEGNAQAKQKADEAEQAQGAGGEAKSSGWWDKIKSAGAQVAGAIKDAAAAVVGVVTRILATARQKVIGVLQALGAAVRNRIAAAARALREGATRAWSAIRAAAARAQQIVSTLAAKAIDLAKRAWAAAAARLAQAWAALQRAVSRAIQSARALVTKVVSALSTLRAILKILTSNMLERLFEAVQDPEGKIVPVIMAKAQPLVGQVPAKADELATEKASSAAQPSTSVQPAVQRDPVTASSLAGQLKPITADEASDLVLTGRIKEKETEVPPPVAGEGFWGGVWRHMKAAGRHFLDNWVTTLRNVVFALLTFYPVLLQEGPKLWEEAKGVINGGGGVDRFDHVLGVLRHLVNIVAGLVATAGIWALIIGAFTGPGEAIVVGAYETVSAAVIGTDFTLSVAEMVKAYVSATTPAVGAATRELYLSMFSGSAIAAAILVILMVLGAIASRLSKAFRRTGPEVAESAKKPPPGEKKPATPEPKPKEPTPAEDGKPKTPESDPDGLKGREPAGEGPLVCQRACLPENEIERARRAQYKKSAQALDQGVDGEGHAFKDHGAQTTEAQHKRRLETGETPGGDHRAVPDQSSKFATHAAQLDAYERAINELASTPAGPNSYLTTTGRMKLRVEVTVPSPGCGFVFTLDAAGNLVRTRAGGFTAVFRLNSGHWYDLVTMFPIP